MKFILLAAGLSLAFINGPLNRRDDERWFSANEVGNTGWGYLTATSSGTSSDFDQNTPLPGPPAVSVDPEPGECLLDTERICAAKFITAADDVTPVALISGQVILGEFRYR